MVTVCAALVAPTSVAAYLGAAVRNAFGAGRSDGPVTQPPTPPGPPAMAGPAPWIVSSVPAAASFPSHRMRDSEPSNSVPVVERPPTARAQWAGVCRVYLAGPR